MKTKHCSQCGREYGASLDDCAFGGETSGLCDDCKATQADVDDTQGDV
jgi:hypothetical protein